MLIFGRNNEAPCCLLCFGYEREVPFLEGGTAFQFACGRFLAQLAMGVFAARRLLSVLFAFAPLFPTAVRRQSSPAGAQEVWRGLFSRVFA